jgi:hypothetical protein
LLGSVTGLRTQLTTPALEAVERIKTAGESACPTKARSVFVMVGQALSPAVFGEITFWDRLKSGLWFLLSHAVQRAQTQHQVCASNAHHFAIGEQMGKNVQGNPVIRVIVSGH